MYAGVRAAEAHPRLPIYGRAAAWCTADAVLHGVVGRRIGVRHGGVMLDDNVTPTQTRGINQPRETSRETLFDLYAIRELSYQKFPDATNKNDPSYSHEEALEEYVHTDVEVSRTRIEAAHDAAAISGSSHAEPSNYLNDALRRLTQVRQELHALINYAYHVDGTSLEQVAETLHADPDEVRDILAAQTHVGPVLKARELKAEG